MEIKCQNDEFISLTGQQLIGRIGMFDAVPWSTMMPAVTGSTITIHGPQFGVS